MRNNQNPIDIVIVNYNTTDHLIRCLHSVFQCHPVNSAKVFVEDNASRDDVMRIQKLFPQVFLEKNGFNMGFARAVNTALRSSRGKYVLILNPDTFILEGFFDPIYQYMEENPRVGVIGPKVLNRDGSVQGSARSNPTPLTALFGRSSLLSKWFPTNPLTSRNLLMTKSDGANPVPVDWVSGACMMVRRAALKEVGFLDEQFFMYWEDADLCRRMWNGGWKVIYFPEASVVHQVGASSRHLVFKSIMEFHKSIYRLFHKYNKPSHWFLNPLVIAGLSLRIPIALILNGIRVWSARNRDPRREKRSLSPFRQVSFGGHPRS